MMARYLDRLCWNVPNDFRLVFRVTNAGLDKEFQIEIVG